VRVFYGIPVFFELEAEPPELRSQRDAGNENYNKKFLAPSVSLGVFISRLCLAALNGDQRIRLASESILQDSGFFEPEAAPPELPPRGMPGTRIIIKNTI